jgi:hypothetical protein
MRRNLCDLILIFHGGFQLLACALEGQLLGTERWCEAMRHGEEGKGEGGDKKAIHHGSLLVRCLFRRLLVYFCERN